MTLRSRRAYESAAGLLLDARLDALLRCRLTLCDFELTYIRTLRRTLYVSVTSRFSNPSHPSFVLVFAASGAHTAAVPVAEHTW